MPYFTSWYVFQFFTSRLKKLKVERISLINSEQKALIEKLLKENAEINKLLGERTCSITADCQTGEICQNQMCVKIVEKQVVIEKTPVWVYILILGIIIAIIGYFGLKKGKN